MEGDGAGPRGFKRKKKKSSYQKFRKNFRPGSKQAENMDEAQVNYFRRVIQLERADEFETPEDKAVFVRNIFKETEGREVELSCSTFVSGLIERILPCASANDLVHFNSAFSAELRKTAVHRVASHVLEKLIEVSASRVRQSGDDTSDDERTHLLDFIVRSSRFLLNNLEEFVTDPYANRVARACLASLSGITVAAEEASEQEAVGQIPEEFSTLAKEFAQTILSWPQLRDMTHSDLPSGLLQSLLRATRSFDKKLTQKVISRLLNDCFDPGGPEGSDDKKYKAESTDQDVGLPDVFGSVASKRLLETAIEVSSPKKFTQIYARVFINRLAHLAIDPNANLTLQKLLRRCGEKVEFEAMYAELSGQLKEILGSGNTGVILALADTCHRLETKQNDFITSLAVAFDCWQPESRQNYMAESILKMKTYTTTTCDEEIIINLHGSLLIQVMLRFKKPIKVINSLLAMDAGQLTRVLCDRRGCHVADAFVLSDSVGEKSRDRLVNKLKGHFVRLAMDKYGSRSFESLWSRAKIQLRTKMAAELSQKEAQVEGNQFGRIVAAKILLPEFRHRNDAWTSRMRAETEGNREAEKTRRLFQDIVGGIAKNEDNTDK